MKMHGNTGEMDGSKIIVSITNAIISPKLLATFTMTGNNCLVKKGVKKNRLKDFVNIIGLIQMVVGAADKMYTQTKFKNDLTYKVMKNAYKEK